MKADPALVASYSEALFEAARKANVLDDVAAQAAEIERLVEGEPKLRSFMGSPNIPRETKDELFTKVFGQSYHPLLINFVRLLIKRGRLELFFPGLDQFRERYQKHLGIVTAKVTTAVALTEEQRTQLEKVMSSFTNLRLLVDYRVEPELLGGVRVQSGDLLIDTTLRKGLDRLRHDLMQAKVY